MKRLSALLWELFKISLFVIGGGYAILAVADETFSKRGWTREGELLEHLPVFQMCPGLIATHVAVYMGRKFAGRTGAALGVFAVALPSIVIFTFVATGYDALPLGNPWLRGAFLGLRSALTGIIAATIVRSWRRNLPDAFSYALMVLSLFLLATGSGAGEVLVLMMIAGLASVFSARGGSAAVFRTSPLALLLFLKYGALCFGGGFVLVPMYIRDFVGPDAPYLQLAPADFANLISLTQMTPGPIGVNGATFFGYRLFGIGGAVLASALLLLPGSVLCYAALSSLERFRESRVVRGILRGVRPASVALMLVALFAFAAMSLVPANRFNPWAVLIVLSLSVTLARKLGVISLLMICAILGALVKC